MLNVRNFVNGYERLSTIHFKILIDNYFSIDWITVDNAHKYYNMSNQYCFI
jgi:hypothetical protein